ncbi:uncharacterized protein, partial [Miscanthus floridulus]|uniref:uncharacterized protein n=1 Tax=Miscanthus floridulus TaxID=154761 RepID=UPI00345B24A7
LQGRVVNSRACLRHATIGSQSHDATRRRRVVVAERPAAPVAARRRQRPNGQAVHPAAAAAPAALIVALVAGRAALAPARPHRRRGTRRDHHCRPRWRWRWRWRRRRRRRRRRWRRRWRRWRRRRRRWRWRIGVDDVDVPDHLAALAAELAGEPERFERPLDGDRLALVVEGDRLDPLMVLELAQNLADLVVALVAIKVNHND